MFKFSLGSSGAFPIIDDLVSHKRLVVEQNRPKIGPQAYVFSVYGVLLTVKCSNSVWGHSVHFRFLTILYMYLLLT